MKRTLFCIILVFILFSGCKSNRDAPRVFEEILKITENGQNSYWIIATDGSPINDKISDKKVAVCDFFTGQNLDANRIFSIQNYPAIILISNGKVAYVTDDNNIVSKIIATGFSLEMPKESSSLEYYYESGNALLDLLNKILEMRYSRSNKSDADLEETREWFSGRYIDNYTFTLYLMYLMEKEAKTIGIDNIFLDKLLSSTEFLSSPLYHSLLRSVITGEGPLSVLIFSRNQIDFGEMNKRSEKEVVLELINSGDIDIRLFRPVVSCPCMKVCYPEKINPRDTASLVVTMKGDSVVGRFEKDIIITSTAKNHTIVIPVKGNII